MNDRDILIGDRVIGTSSRVLVIAEIGLNHNGDVQQAKRLIDAAADAGAEAVKFQSFRTDHLLIPARDRYAQQGEGAESAYQLLRRCELSFDAQAELKAHADARGVLFLSTPFDEVSADFLDSLGVPLFKIASGDITHVPLLKHIASKLKPVVLSTGMSYLSEVADAVWNLKSAGTGEILLMHCVSAYPAEAAQMNLRALVTLQSYFDLPVGLSDHSLGTVFPLIAVALGATVIEKHFTLDKNAPGPDHKSSLDPREMKELIQRLQDVEAGLGDGRKTPSEAEAEGRKLGRRSIVAAADIRENEPIERWMLDFKRPGTGLEPACGERIVGMTARRNIEKNTILQWEDLLPAAPVSEELSEPNREANANAEHTHSKQRNV